MLEEALAHTTIGTRLSEHTIKTLLSEHSHITYFYVRSASWTAHLLISHWLFE